MAHKPFKIHETQKKWLERLHDTLEMLVTIQGMILINEWIRS